MDNLLKLIDAPFQFRARPVTVPGDYRPAWRIALIALILDHSRAKQASLQKLHVISWVLRSAGARRQFLEMAAHGADASSLIIRIDPTLNLAVNLAVAEGLTVVSKGKNLQLTGKGKKLAEEIQSDAECMVEEKRFLEDIAAFATEAMINNLLNLSATS